MGHHVWHTNNSLVFWCFHLFHSIQFCTMMSLIIWLIIAFFHFNNSVHWMKFMQFCDWNKKRFDANASENEWNSNDSLLIHSNWRLLFSNIKKLPSWKHKIYIYLYRLSVNKLLINRSTFNSLIKKSQRKKTLIPSITMQYLWESPRGE